MFLASRKSADDSLFSLTARDEVVIMSVLASTGLEVRRDQGLESWTLDIFALNTPEGESLPSRLLEPGTRTMAVPTKTYLNAIPSRIYLEYVCSRVKRWHHECTTTHTACQDAKQPHLPTRLLFLGSVTSPCLRLVVRRSCDQQSAPYTALSYCWGNVSTIKLTEEKLDTFMLEVPSDQLPQLFKDAVAVTVALGVQYIWIDSLCILQGDPKDWEREAGTMASVYSNSYLTIAATGSPNPHVGLFENRWTYTHGEWHGIDDPPRIWQTSIASVAFNFGKDQYTIRPRLHLAHYRFQHGNLGDPEYYSDAPLMSRAWAFQERLLSTRTLHFHAEEMVWECKRGVNCECNKLRYDNRREDHHEVYEGYDDNSGGGTYLKQRLAMINDTSTPPSKEEMGILWMTIIQGYSELRLTSELDRLPALAGLASKFLEPNIMGDYLAGVWTNNFVRGLYFRVDLREHTGSRSGLPRDAVVRAQPSWSWATKVSEFHYPKFEWILDWKQHREFKLLAFDHVPKHENLFGWASVPTVRVSGYVSTARITYHKPDPASLNPSKKYVPVYYSGYHANGSRTSDKELCNYYLEVSCINIQGENFWGDAFLDPWQCLDVEEQLQDEQQVYCLKLQTRPNSESGKYLILKAKGSRDGHYSRVGVLILYFNAEMDGRVMEMTLV